LIAVIFDGSFVRYKRSNRIALIEREARRLVRETLASVPELMPSILVAHLAWILDTRCEALRQSPDSSTIELLDICALCLISEVGQLEDSAHVDSDNGLTAIERGLSALLVAHPVLLPGATWLLRNFRQSDAALADLLSADNHGPGTFHDSGLCDPRE